MVDQTPETTPAVQADDAAEAVAQEADDAAEAVAQEAAEAVEAAAAGVAGIAEVAAAGVAAGVVAAAEAEGAAVAEELADIAEAGVSTGVKVADEASGVFAVSFTYPSADGKSQINAKLWTKPAFGTPDAPGPGKPTAIIQIVHGMAEYIDRYDEMARWYVKRGFVVCAEDHIGHGKTAANAAEFGHMPIKGGKDILIADVNRLRAQVSKCYPGVPYVMYGHSMGSFIVRAYIARYGQGLAAAQLLRDAGVQHVDDKIYEGMRHEIHNEFGREQVFDDVATWLEGVL